MTGLEVLKMEEITQAEKIELDEYDRIEHLMVMIKTDNLPFPTIEERRRAKEIS